MLVSVTSIEAVTARQGTISFGPSHSLPDPNLNTLTKVTNFFTEQEIYGLCMYDPVPQIL